jgi:hypothetical protein
MSPLAVHNFHMAARIAENTGCIYNDSENINKQKLGENSPWQEYQNDCIPQRYHLEACTVNFFDSAVCYRYAQTQTHFT